MTAPEPGYRPEDQAHDAGYDAGLSDGATDERSAIVEWLRRLDPRTLGLRDDSMPLTVIFAIREALERGEHEKA